MTIQVRSSDAPRPEVKTSEAQEPAQDANLSALAQKPAEQKASEESDPSETEEAGNENEDPADESESESSDEDMPKDSAKDKPKAKSGFKRRIDKLSREKSQALQEADFWKREALKHRGATELKADATESKAKTPENGKPKPEDFDSHADWVEAVADWKADQKVEAKLKEREEKAEKAKLQSDQEKVEASFRERVNAFAEKTEDWGEVLESVDDVPVSLSVQQLLVSSENGPELMYELAKNRAEFERINALPPLAAARELGRFESKLTSSSRSSEAKPEQKTITKAPKPLDPVGGKGGKVRKTIYDPSLTQAEYEELRAEQERKRA